MSNAREQAELHADIGRDFLSAVTQQIGDFAETIKHCFGQLDDRQVWWRPRGELNSIGNLVLHLTGNLRKRILSDIGGEPFDRDRFGEFTEKRLIPRDELLRGLDEILNQIVVILTAMPAEQLREHRQYTVVAGSIDDTVQSLLLRTVTHLAGHTQEIVLMTRLQLGERYAFKHPAGVPPSMRSEPG